MAYISTEEVKHIRNALKAEMPEYKFSVTKDGHYGVRIAFMEGKAWKPHTSIDRYTGEGVVWTGEGYHQLNHKWAVDFYGEENGKIIEKVVKIAKTAPLGKGGLNSDGWYDKSDAMTDYFDIAFYIWVNIGKWDKPYKVVPELKATA